MVAKTVALKKIDLLWKVHCTRSWHVMFKAVGILEVVCMCSAAILEISEILCVGCVMEHTRAHTHTSSMMQVAFQENWENSSLVYELLFSPSILKNRWKTGSTDNHGRKYKYAGKNHLSSLCLFFESCLHFSSKLCFG